MPAFDHLVVIAPSLDEGLAHVRASLGIDVPPGGRHPEMGTHNHVVRLDAQTYLEVIAIDPDAPPPAGPRWFGLDDAPALRAAWDRGERLRSYVARTDDLDAYLGVHRDLFGRKARVSRGGMGFWFSLLPDGRLPGDGALPSIIDREGRPLPATRMPDAGLCLVDFVLEHPEPDAMAALYGRLGIAGAPRVVPGERVRLRATIETPSGPRALA